MKCFSIKLDIKNNKNIFKNNFKNNFKIYNKKKRLKLQINHF